MATGCYSTPGGRLVAPVAPDAGGTAALASASRTRRRGRPTVVVASSAATTRAGRPRCPNAVARPDRSLGRPTASFSIATASASYGTCRTCVAPAGRPTVAASAGGTTRRAATTATSAAVAFSRSTTVAIQDGTSVSTAGVGQATPRTSTTCATTPLGAPPFTGTGSVCRCRHPATRRTFGSTVTAGASTRIVRVTTRRAAAGTPPPCYVRLGTTAPATPATKSRRRCPAAASNAAVAGMRAEATST